jgi:hypothetical protein
MGKQPEFNFEPNDGWVAPRLAFLDKLIAAARKQGSYPNGQEAETIDGLKTYISKKLPGSDELRAKLDELHAVLYDKDLYGNAELIKDPIDKSEKKTDPYNDDDPVTAEQLSNLSERPEFDPKASSY